MNYQDLIPTIEELIVGRIGIIRLQRQFQNEMKKHLEAVSELCKDMRGKVRRERIGRDHHDPEMVFVYRLHDLDWIVTLNPNCPDPNRVFRVYPAHDLQAELGFVEMEARKSPISSCPEPGLKEASMSDFLSAMLGKDITVVDVIRLDLPASDADTQSVHAPSEPAPAAP